MRGNKLYIIVGVVAIAALGLIVFSRFTNPTPSVWGNTSIECLSLGHQNLALHIHQLLRVEVDGANETIPANIGVSAHCMAEVHTHDETGTIHIESNVPGRTFTLRDFFSVWGQRPEREGYESSVTVDGSPASFDLVLVDGQNILVQYNSISE